MADVNPNMFDVSKLAQRVDVLSARVRDLTTQWENLTVGLFDGVVAKFADKLCEHLNNRSSQLLEEANTMDLSKPENAYPRMRNFIVSATLAEIATAILTVKES